MAKLPELNWREEAARLALPTQAVIDGRKAGAASGRTFDRVSPIDGRVIAQVPRCLWTLGTSSGECWPTAPTIGR